MLRTVIFLLPFMWAVSASSEQVQILNPAIDTAGFQSDVSSALSLRASRRITEEQFVEMAKDAKTIILDARTKGRFDLMHIAGAKHLAFTDFTEAALRSAIPDRETRILIYCNNNIKNSELAFPTKVATAALNLSTFTSLYSYGHHNVYELGPVIDPEHSKVQFAGILIDTAQTAQAPGRQNP